MQFWCSPPPSLPKDVEMEDPTVRGLIERATGSDLVDIWCANEAIRRRLSELLEKDGSEESGEAKVGEDGAGEGKNDDEEEAKEADNASDVDGDGVDDDEGEAVGAESCVV